jgi:putative cardiolipin synthase
LACAAAWLLAGCASLPDQPPRPPSQALQEWASTPLAEQAAKRAPVSADALSGFHLLVSAADSLSARLELIRRAEKSIDAQYYLIQGDGTGRAFLRALRDAGQRGVRVRLLVDDLYTAGEEPLLRGLCATPNVEVRLFNPLPARGIGIVSRHLLSLTSLKRTSRRMHNKLFIADNAASVSGGRNVSDAYFMRQPLANFVDLDILAVGPVVREQSAVFDRFWNSQEAYDAMLLIGAGAGPVAARDEFERLTSAPADIAATPGAPSVIDGVLTGSRTLDWAPARVLADDPIKAEGKGRVKPADTALGESVAIFESASKEIYAISPYFVPGPRGMAVIDRLRARGVRLVVLTNSLAATDETVVFGAYAKYRLRLLQEGVEINELSPERARRRGHITELGRSNAMLHAKFGIVDRRILVIGSMNLDPRSADINTEVGLRIDSPELAFRLVDLLAADRFESAYRLRLTPDGKHIEWVATEDGTETIYDHEPEVSFLRRLEMFLIAPWIPEDLL